jgi:hypothetical protein
MVPWVSLHGSGPPSGVHLCHCADRVIHHASSHDFLAGSQSSISVPFGEDLDHGDGVLPVSNVRVNILFQAGCVQMGPMVAHCFGTMHGNTSLDPLVDISQFSAEYMGLRD